MFYFSDIKPDMRSLLDDEYSPYRFREDELRDYSLKAVTQIGKIRPDSKIDKYGRIRKENTVYDYTDTEYYLDEYDRILNWDRYANRFLYAKQTATAVITFYTSDANRTAGTNEVATVEDADSIGIKSVREANDSKWDGSIDVTKVAALNATWDVEATENAYALDDIFKEAVIYYVVARCYGQDNADTFNGDKEKKHDKQFMRELI
jgi:hypothetical protein